MPADAAPRRSTPWLRAPSSTLSTRSTISPTCSPALPIIRHGALPNSCPGIGSPPTPPAPPPKSAHSPSAYVDQARSIQALHHRAVGLGGAGVDTGECAADGAARARLLRRLYDAQAVRRVAAAATGGRAGDPV